jgi:UDP-N-acetylmuramoyl-tripeptide--D-alanyl-D-alanine ligase
MNSIRLSEMATCTNAELIGRNETVDAVYTDSRSDLQEGLFVALKGQNFDAHDYLDKVEEKGAKAVLVERKSNLNIPQLVVKDTRLALGKIAQLNKQKSKARTIAITGSSGKTTVKEMIAAILSNIGKTTATQGNYNNDIGVPLTLFQLDNSHDYAVVELGANQPGDIQYTVDLVEPDVALVNNVSASHLEGLGSLQGIAEEKGKIYSGLKQDGVAVINLDDQFASFWKKSIKNRVISFSRSNIENNPADLIAKNIELNENQYPRFQLHYQSQVVSVKLPLIGEHNVNNALAAIACCLGLDIELEEIINGLRKSPEINGRLVSFSLANNSQLIDDTYNANLGSTRAAIELLAGYATKRVFVLGNMRELGDFSKQAHEEIGELANNKGIERLYTFGDLACFAQEKFKGKGEHFSNKKQLIEALTQELDSNTTFLVKGSRGMQMEEVVNGLKEKCNQLSNLQERVN